MRTKLHECVPLRTMWYRLPPMDGFLGGIVSGGYSDALSKRRGWNGGAVVSGGAARDVLKQGVETKRDGAFV